MSYKFRHGLESIATLGTRKLRFSEVCYKLSRLARSLDSLFNRWARRNIQSKADYESLQGLCNQLNNELSESNAERRRQTHYNWCYEGLFRGYQGQVARLETELAARDVALKIYQKDAEILASRLQSALADNLKATMESLRDAFLAGDFGMLVALIEPRPMSIPLSESKPSSGTGSRT